MRLVDARECLEPGESGHVLVEEHERVGLAVEGVEGVAAVAHGVDVISFCLQEQYVGLEKVDLIVGP